MKQYEINNFNSCLVRSSKNSAFDLHPEVLSCVGVGSWSKSTFVYSILQAREFWDRHDHPSFPLFHQKKCSKASIILFANYPASKCFGRTFWSSLKTKSPLCTVQHNSTQISFTPKNLICRFVFFGQQKEHP